MGLFALMLGCTSATSETAGGEGRSDDEVVAKEGAKEHTARILYVSFGREKLTKAPDYVPEKGEASTDDPRKNLSSKVGATIPPFAE